MNFGVSHQTPALPVAFRSRVPALRLCRHLPHSGDRMKSQVDK
ncbi:hypothetical protein [Limibacterium fermenti]